MTKIHDVRTAKRLHAQACERCSNYRELLAASRRLNVELTKQLRAQRLNVVKVRDRIIESLAIAAQGQKDAQEHLEGMITELRRWNRVGPLDEVPAVEETAEDVKP